MNKTNKQQPNMLNLAYEEGWGVGGCQCWVCPLWYRCLQPPSYFSMCKTFSLLFLKLFCPRSLLPVHVSYSQEKVLMKKQIF